MLSTVLLLEVRGTLYPGNLFAFPLRLECHDQQQDISPTSTILLLQTACQWASQPARTVPQLGLLSFAGGVETPGMLKLGCDHASRLETDCWYLIVPGGE